ncbi:unnamed protein product [Dracunculus medinensis]|uniref:Uncharacterized protein n=1 Tax=Dracunculus medinensis TaxID=318479 RepID=A0A0N4UHE9_DRAME|nr:unnamed protein product [Dracunculus medinensis]
MTDKKGKKKKTVLSTTSPSHLAEKSKAPQDSVTTNWLPERISSKQFTYKGPLVIRAKQDSTVRHELESEDPSSLESGHVTFDDALNEAYEVGTGVEIRLNNENQDKERNKIVQKTEQKVNQRRKSISSKAILLDHYGSAGTFIHAVI